MLIADEWLLYPLKETESRDLLEIVESWHKRNSSIFCSQFDIPAGRKSCLTHCWLMPSATESSTMLTWSLEARNPCASGRDCKTSDSDHIYDTLTVSLHSCQQFTLPTVIGGCRNTPLSAPFAYGETAAPIFLYTIDHTHQDLSNNQENNCKCSSYTHSNCRTQINLRNSLTHPMSLLQIGSASNYNYTP